VIKKANHTIHLELDGAETNRTYNYPTLTNATGYLEIVPGGAAASLLRDGVAVATGDPTSEVVTLAAGLYNYTYFYPASQNFSEQSVTRFLTINPSNTTLSLTADPSFTIFNGTQTNVSCSADNNQVTISLYRNSSLIGSSTGGVVSDVQTLPEGNYDYECNTTGSQNYTGANVSNVLTVTMKNVSNCFLAFDPTTNGVYPINVNASCTCDNPEANATLYRDGVDVTSENNVFTILPAGSFAYVCNVSETVSYSAAVNASTYVIRKANHTIHLELDGAELNRSYSYPTLTNATGYLEITQGSGAASLLRNGTVIVSGSPSTEYSTLGAGLYNYTYNYPASQNYTAQSVTRFLKINKSATILSLTSLPSFSVINGTQTNVTCTANNNEVGMDLFRNGILISSSTGSISDVQTLPNGTYNYSCVTDFSQNYTSASIWRILNITLTPTPGPKPSTAASGGGARGRSKAPEVVEQPIECTSETTCGEWSKCIEGIKTRNCMVSDSCEGNYKQEEERSCGAKNISLYVMEYPASISLESNELVIPVRIDNTGTEYLEDVWLNIDSNDIFPMENIKIGDLNIGEKKVLDLKFENKLCKMNSFTLDTNMKISLAAVESDVSDSEVLDMTIDIPEFTVLTDETKYSEGDVMRVCLIYNNEEKEAKNQIEFELNLYDEKDSPYIIDYLNPYEVDKNRILFVTRDFSLDKIPATTHYKLDARMYDKGSLFKKEYLIGKDDAKIFLNGFVEEKILEKQSGTYEFAFENEPHTITVDTINENYVELTVASTPKQIKLKLLESTMVDLDDDGELDITITYVGMKDGKADIRTRTLPRQPKTVMVPSFYYEVGMGEKSPVIESPQVVEKEPLWYKIKSIFVTYFIRFLMVALTIYLLTVCIAIIHNLIKNK